MDSAARPLPLSRLTFEGKFACEVLRLLFLVNNLLAGAGQAAVLALAPSFVSLDCFLDYCVLLYVGLAAGATTENLTFEFEFTGAHLVPIFLEASSERKIVDLNFIP